jgi:hypothetical protein
MLAEDCAADHWAAALDGHRERSGWRADCPLCGAARAIEWDVPRSSVRWKTWCAAHDREAVRPVLEERLEGHLPRRRGGRTPVDRDDLIALALGGLPPMTMKLMMLRLAGLGTNEALDKLGVRPDNRARVIGGRTGKARPFGRETAGRLPRPNGRGVAGKKAA